MAIRLPLDFVLEAHVILPYWLFLLLFCTFKITDVRGKEFRVISRPRLWVLKEALRISEKTENTFSKGLGLGWLCGLLITCFNSLQTFRFWSPGK